MPNVVAFSVRESCYQLWLRIRPFTFPRGSHLPLINEREERLDIFGVLIQKNDTIEVQFNYMINNYECNCPELSLFIYTGF